MDNRKDNQYYIKKIVTDLQFILDHTVGLTQEELEENEILVDSVMFRLIQISENSDKLTDTFKQSHSAIPWRAVKGIVPLVMPTMSMTVASLTTIRISHHTAAMALSLWMPVPLSPGKSTALLWMT